MFFHSEAIKTEKYTVPEKIKIGGIDHEQEQNTIDRKLRRGI